MARSGYYRPPQQSELAVFTRAKELSKAVFLVTQDAPKKFRFSLVSRLQDLSLEVVGRLYRANEIFIDPAALSGKPSAGVKGRMVPEVKSGCPDDKNRAGAPAEQVLCRHELAVERAVKRLDEQTAAMACLKELDHLLVLAREMQCINGRQHEQLAVNLAAAIKLLGGWIKADRKRLGITL